MRRGYGVWAALIAGLVVAVAQLGLLAGSAPAATGGAGVVPGTTNEALPPSPAGPAPSTSPNAGVIQVTSAKVSSRKSFYYGVHEPRLSFTISSTQPQNDLRIDVVNSATEIVRTLYRNDVSPDTPTAVRWDGNTAEGRPARTGEYSFRIGPQGPATSARTAIKSSISTLSFSLYGYIFPVQGAHTYGDGIGAPRVGHTHQGRDIAAACGTPILAARGGRVQFSTYQAGGGGNYVVIDGKGTRQDTVYMHMKEPALLPVGSAVRTGQTIGYVGDTGDSKGCHLHFELWSAPGWSEGGEFMDPTPLLKRADEYS